MQTLTVNILSGGQTATTIGRNRKCKTRIQADHSTGDHPSPGNSHQPHSVGIHIGQRTQQRIGEDRIGNRMIHPLLSNGLSRVMVNTVALRPRPLVALPALRRVVDRGSIQLPLDRDADGRIAPRIPLLYPLLKGSPATAMHQHYRGHLPLALFRITEPRKHLGRLPLPVQSIIINCRQVATRSIPFRQLHFRGGGQRRQRFHGRSRFGKLRQPQGSALSRRATRACYGADHFVDG